MPARRVGIVGGGWAGLAAAVAAVQCGHHVTLLEMAPGWGGRARAVTVDDQLLDNGQHILIGAYRETLKLMCTVGVDVDAALLRLPLRLVYPDGSGLCLRSGRPTTAFATAVWRQPGWRLSERLALLAAATGWAAGGFRCDPRSTVAGLTARLPARARRELIDPLCVAALNTPATEASAQVFLRVVRDALLSGPGAADLLLPRTDLGRLFPAHAAAWLDGAGATLRLGCRVERIERAGDGAWQVGLGLRNRGEAEAIEVDHLVLASTARESARLVRPLAPEWSRAADALAHEPIVTVYLKAAGVRLPEPMLALHEDDASPRSSCSTAASSAAPPDCSPSSSAARAPGSPPAHRRSRPPLPDRRAGCWARRRRSGRPVTLTEKRATFRCTPALLRPAMAIAAGLVAAGDHVDGPYPATLEGAVRSGLAAAACIDNGDRARLSAGRTAPPAARR